MDSSEPPPSPRAHLPVASPVTHGLDRTGAPHLHLRIDAPAWHTAAPADWSLLAMRAVRAALSVAEHGEPAELSLCLSDDAAVRALNAQFRAKDRPTNVLAFPAEPLPAAWPTELMDGADACDAAQPGEQPRYLGDVILAFETLRAEAEAERKPLAHHVSHLVVHGMLHLLGFDHTDEDEARAMEALEVAALAALAIPDPYTPASTEEERAISPARQR